MTLEGILSDFLDGKCAINFANGSEAAECFHWVNDHTKLTWYGGLNVLDMLSEVEETKGIRVDRCAGFHLRRMTHKHYDAEAMAQYRRQCRENII